MRLIARPGARLQGSAKTPPDKSISHRAVMFGAMARGTTTISNLLTGEDCLATVAAFRALGVGLKLDGTTCTIDGFGTGFADPGIIDVGNSGTTMRLLMGILSGAKVFAVLTGDDSLSRRPMARVAEPLGLMGAHIHGRKGNTLAPIAICPADLTAIHYRSPVASAQVKSAILLAGLSAHGVTTVSEPYLSRDHTERMLTQFGVIVERSSAELSASVAGGQELTGTSVTVPGDISSAAFILAAGLLSGGGEVVLDGVGLNPTRDGVLEVLRQWGADYTLEASSSGQPEHSCAEPVGNLTCRPSELLGSDFGGSIIPRLIDEVPILAVLCAFAEGETRIRDAAELRVKESDRIATVAAALRQGGVCAGEHPDGLSVRGLGPRGRFRAGEYESYGDHRLAMALCIAALRADGPIVVRDAECIATSFPNFVSTLNQLSCGGVPWLEALEG